MATKRLRDMARVLRHQESEAVELEGHPWFRVNLVVPVVLGVVSISPGGEAEALAGYGERRETVSRSA